MWMGRKSWEMKPMMEHSETKGLTNLRSEGSTAHDVGLHEKLRDIFVISPEGIENKSRRKGIAEAALFYVNAGAKTIHRIEIEEDSGVGFDQKTLVGVGLTNPKSLAADLKYNKIYWTDMLEGVVKRCRLAGCDGSKAEQVVSEAVKPTVMRLDTESGTGRRMIYWSDQKSLEGTEDYTLMRQPMDDPDASPQLVQDVAGHVRGMAVYKDHFYYTDYYEGTMNRIKIGADEDIDNPEILVEGLTEPQYMDISEDGYAIWSESDGVSLKFVDVTSDPSSWPLTPRTLVDELTGFIDDVRANNGHVLWSDKLGFVYSGVVPYLAENEGTKFDEDSYPFVKVVDGLEKPKGLEIIAWPKSDGLRFTVSDKYNEAGGPPIYSAYPWALGPVVERFQPTTLRPVDPVDGMSYEWDYHGKTYSSPAIKLTFKLQKAVPIVLREKDSAGTITREFHGYVQVKRVRREIKSLTRDDREKFFNAIQTLMNVATDDGTSTFGEGFKDMEHFIKRHNSLGGARDCDHMHHGMGFLFQHMGLTLEFEQALQAVDPTLTVPYWDYTVEGKDIYNAGRGKPGSGDFDKLWSSIMFDPDWFGTADEETHTVTEGRWANKLEVGADGWEDTVHNSYGMIRAPWNNNNFPYVQRFTSFAGIPVQDVATWPTCGDHHDVITRNSDWRSFAYKISGPPHNAVHGKLGGTTGSEETYDQLESILDPADVHVLRLHSMNTPKNLWRQGLSECPEFCDDDVPPSECHCSCGDDVTDRISSDPDLLDQYWKAATAGGDKLSGSYSDQDKIDAIALLCEAPTIIGDQLSSASPADPIFWPVHPTVDRLFQWKMLNGGFEDTTWNLEDSYTGSVMIGLDQTCDGHGADDLLSWDLRLDTSTVTGSTALQAELKRYTNAQMMELQDPSTMSYEMPYVYDNFQWPHCAEVGIDFDEL